MQLARTLFSLAKHPLDKPQSFWDFFQETGAATVNIKPEYLNKYMTQLIPKFTKSFSKTETEELLNSLDDYYFMNTFVDGDGDAAITISEYFEDKIYLNRITIRKEAEKIVISKSSSSLPLKISSNYHYVSVLSNSFMKGCQLHEAVYKPAQLSTEIESFLAILFAPYALKLITYHPDKYFEIHRQLIQFAHKNPSEFKNVAIPTEEEYNRAFCQ